ncbi:MAG TPA: exodeoxyribonuclease VII small subunit [Nitrospirae bacterium]|nr:exodeoxyribonuclease VII small subunit [Nitrospirota bacterium]
MMKKNPSYKQAIDEIESIVNEIENETVDVDTLALKVKRAAYLIKLCREKLKTTDDEVKKILKEFDREGEGSE